MLYIYNATARLPCGGEGALFYHTQGKVEYFKWFPTIMALSTFYLDLDFHSILLSNPELKAGLAGLVFISIVCLFLSH